MKKTIFLIFVLAMSSSFAAEKINVKGEKAKTLLKALVDIGLKHQGVEMVAYGATNVECSSVVHPDAATTCSFTDYATDKEKTVANKTSAKALRLALLHAGLKPVNPGALGRSRVEAYSVSCHAGFNMMSHKRIAPTCVIEE